MHTEPLEILRAIQAATLQHASPMPLVDEKPTQWQGLAFTVGGVKLVAGLGDVSELMPMPKYTSLPGVKPWLLGIANLRGRLVPVVDLHAYLGLRTTCPPNASKVFIVEDEEFSAGLVVEQSLGMAQFVEEDHAQISPEGADHLGSLSTYVSGAFVRDGETYHQVELGRIFKDEAFFDVAEVTQ